VKGIIRTGGFGARLNPLTNNIRKHLVSIKNKALEEIEGAENTYVDYTYGRKGIRTREILRGCRMDPGTPGVLLRTNVLGVPTGRIIPEGEWGLT
jgi:hypothetical protein